MLELADKLEEAIQAGARFDFDEPSLVTSVGNPATLRHLRQFQSLISLTEDRSPQEIDEIENFWDTMSPKYERLNYTPKRGGMCEVFHARPVDGSDDVAIKILNAEFRHGLFDEERFSKGCEILQKIEDPNVVRVIEFEWCNDIPFLVMEWLPEGSLADRMNGRPFDPEKAAAIIEQVAKGVHQLHRQGMVHRDVKPGNILFDASDNPKIADFDLVKSRRPAASDLTMTGMFIGTPDYASPEQIKRAPRLITSKCDIFSLGVVLYELLTGNLPFKGNDEQMLEQQILGQHPPGVRRSNPAVPIALHNICMNCLEKDPDDRIYSHAGELAEDLQRLLKNQPVLARAAPAGVRFRRWSRQNPRLAGTLLTAAVASAILIAVLTTSVMMILSSQSKRNRMAGIYVERLDKTLEDYISQQLEQGWDKPVSIRRMMDALLDNMSENIQLVKENSELFFKNDQHQRESLRDMHMNAGDAGFYVGDLERALVDMDRAVEFANYSWEQYQTDDNLLRLANARESHAIISSEARRYENSKTGFEEARDLYRQVAKRASGGSAKTKKVIADCNAEAENSELMHWQVKAAAAADSGDLALFRSVWEEAKTVAKTKRRWQGNPRFRELFEAPLAACDYLENNTELRDLVSFPERPAMESHVNSVVVSRAIIDSDWQRVETYANELMERISENPSDDPEDYVSSRGFMQVSAFLADAAKIARDLGLANEYDRLASRARAVLEEAFEKVNPASKNRVAAFRELRNNALQVPVFEEIVRNPQSAEFLATLVLLHEKPVPGSSAHRN